MKPLGFSLDQMRSAMRDLELLDDPHTSGEERLSIRRRLDAVRAEATERRRVLVHQVEMADEFIALIVEQAQ